MNQSASSSDLPPDIGSSGINSDETPLEQQTFFLPQTVCLWPLEGREDGILFSNLHRILGYHFPNQLTFICGNTEPGYQEGNFRAAKFNSVGGLCVLPSGQLLVSDTDNHRLRLVDTEGSTQLLAGSSESGKIDGQFEISRFNRPMGLCLLPNGTVILADCNNHVLRCINLQTKHVTTIAGTGEPFNRAGFSTATSSFLYPSHLTFGPHSEIIVTTQSFPKAPFPIMRYFDDGIVTLFETTSSPVPTSPYGLFYDFTIGQLRHVSKKEQQQQITYQWTPVDRDDLSDLVTISPVTPPASPSPSLRSSDSLNIVNTQERFDLTELGRYFSKLKPCLLSPSTPMAHIIVEGYTPYLTSGEGIFIDNGDDFTSIIRLFGNDIQTAFGQTNLFGVVGFADFDNSIVGLHEPFWPYFRQLTQRIGRSTSNLTDPSRRSLVKIRIMSQVADCVINHWTENGLDTSSIMIRDGVSFNKIFQHLREFERPHDVIEGSNSIIAHQRPYSNLPMLLNRNGYGFPPDGSEGDPVIEFSTTPLKAYPVRLLIYGDLAKGNEDESSPKEVEMTVATSERVSDFLIRISRELKLETIPLLYLDGKQCQSWDKGVTELGISPKRKIEIFPRDYRPSKSSSLNSNGIIEYQGNLLSFQVLTLRGELRPVSGFDEETLVEELRLTVAFKFDVQVSSVRLIYKGRSLIEGHPLKHYAIDSGDTVFAVFRYGRIVPSIFPF